MNDIREPDPKLPPPDPDPSRGKPGPPIKEPDKPGPDVIDDPMDPEPSLA
jgi:hypothetical protein